MSQRDLMLVCMVIALMGFVYTIMDLVFLAREVKENPSERIIDHVPILEEPSVSVEGALA